MAPFKAPFIGDSSMLSFLFIAASILENDQNEAERVSKNPPKKRFFLLLPRHTVGASGAALLKRQQLALEFIIHLSFLLDSFRCVLVDTIHEESPLSAHSRVDDALFQVFLLFCSFF